MQGLEPNSAQFTNIQHFIQPGYTQSCSGSETDVSTSTENLTTEEKNVLRSGVRQEPQGEETLIEDIDSISSSNTLIIHSNHSIDGYSSPFYGKNILSNSKPSHNLCAIQGVGPPHNKQFCEAVTSLPLKMQNFGNMSDLSKHLQLKSEADNLAHLYSAGLKAESNLDYSTKKSLNGKVTDSRQDISVQEITEIPKHYLDQSEVLKHLAKEVHYSRSSANSKNSKLPPGYAYSQQQDMSDVKEATSVNHLDKLSLSHSNPDLTSIGSALKFMEERPKTKGCISGNVDSETTSHHSVHSIIDLLSAENAALKCELDNYYRKVCKLQKFELEIQKVHQGHDDLVRSSEKREKLERTIRTRLEMEIRRLQEMNHELKERLDAAMMQLTINKRPVMDSNDSEIRKEIGRRDKLVSQLLTQNRELAAEKERQEIELQAQRATLQEQRNHIDILDKALTNAQANVVKLEEECRQKQALAERVPQLQKALSNMQVASERRLQMEKRLRVQLEKEIESLKTQKNGQSSDNMKSGEVNDINALKKQVIEYEEKIISLEAEVSKWEQRYLEESAMRQIAVDAASVPKDAKIAALERTSQESEKLIQEARTEKLKHMDEMYATQRKVAELDEKIKDMESKLAEKDAMIRVLQQHSQEKDFVLQSALSRNSPRHARSASSTGLTSHSSSSAPISMSASSISLHCRTGSKDELGTSSLATSMTNDSCLRNSEESLTLKKSIDEPRKEELDSRLCSKDSVITALKAEKDRFPNHFWKV